MSDENETRRWVVRWDLFGAIKRLETHNRKRYTYAYISDRTKLHKNIVRRLATSQKVARVDVDTMDSFVKFFQDEGFTEFWVGDLFVKEPVTEAA